MNFLVEKVFYMGYHLQCFNGHMAELVDALVSGTSGSNTLEVRVFLCPPYVKKERYGVVAQLVERCVRNAEVVSSNLISSTSYFVHTNKIIGDSPWGYGGMVDAEDLKSFDHCDRVGSSPTIPTTNFYRSEARTKN